MTNCVQHMAWKVTSNGGMSAICFGTLRPIDMKRETWTLAPSAVTCCRCLKVLKLVNILVKPKVCPAVKLPSFNTPEEMEAFMKANAPQLKIVRVARCICCNGWHAKTEPIDRTEAQQTTG